MNEQNNKPELDEAADVLAPIPSETPAEQQPLEITPPTPPEMALSTPAQDDEFDAYDDEDEDVIVFRRSNFFLALLPITFILGLTVGYILWGSGNTQQTAQTESDTAAQVVVVPSNNVDEAQNEDVVADAPVADESAANVDESENTEAAAEASQTVTRYDVPVDDDPFIGPEDAAITIIEFSDYECPFCKKWHDEVFFQLLENYPDEVRIVYRDFPLTNIHPNAITAAVAANCANAQERYWDYHSALFSDDYGLNRNAFVQYAEDLNLDVDAFTTCLDSGEYQAEVQADFDFAANLGIRSTPTFFINGIAVVGAQPYEVFQEVIEGELAGLYD